MGETLSLVQEKKALADTPGGYLMRFPSSDAFQSIKPQASIDDCKSKN
jgi:hypothetical protein